METPNPNLPDPEPPGVGSSTHRVLSDQQKYALVALGGLTLVAVVLGLLARRRRAGAVADEFAAVPITADWAESMRHLAYASDLRFQGHNQRLDALEEALGLHGKVVTETVPNMGTAASSVMPPVIARSADGRIPVANQTPPVGDGTESPPPRPATFSE